MAGQTPAFTCVPVSNSVTPLPPLSCRMVGLDEWIHGMGLCRALHSEQAQVAFLIIYLG